VDSIAAPSCVISTCSERSDHVSGLIATAEDARVRLWRAIWRAPGSCAQSLDDVSMDKTNKYEASRG
jgi:hypothetical protein